MRKHTLLNAPLASVISTMGHTDQLVIGDAGLPIPAQPQRIDLAVKQGTPAFMDVLETTTTELQVEKAIMAEEFQVVSPELHAVVLKHLADLAAKQGNEIAIQYVSHEAFKQQTLHAKAVVRTGECTPYANIILEAGVVF